MPSSIRSLRGGLRPRPTGPRERCSSREVGDRLLHRARRDAARSRPQPAARMCGTAARTSRIERQQVRLDRGVERVVVHVERAGLRRAARVRDEDVRAAEPLDGRPRRASRRRPGRSRPPAIAKTSPPQLRPRSPPGAPRLGRRSRPRHPRPPAPRRCRGPSPLDAAVTSATLPSSPRSMAPMLRVPARRHGTRSPHALTLRLPSCCAHRGRSRRCAARGPLDTRALEEQTRSTSLRVASGSAVIERDLSRRRRGREGATFTCTARAPATGSWTAGRGRRRSTTTGTSTSGSSRHEPRRRSRAARGQEAAHHRGADAAVDRVRGGPVRPGAGRGDRPHELRPDGEPHREDGQAAARSTRRARDRRERRRRRSTPVARRARRAGGDALDGFLHAIAFAPQDALGGNFLQTPWESVADRVPDERVLAEGPRGRDAAADGSERGRSIVSLDFDATVAWPIYDWMGVAKAGLESVTRYLARDLGPKGIRVNRRERRPDQDDGRQGHPGLRPDRRPLGAIARRWAGTRPTPRPVGDAVAFLLSDLSRGHHRRAHPRRRRVPRDGDRARRSAASDRRLRQSPRSERRLTSFSHGAGCGCKLGPDDLLAVLGGAEAAAGPDGRARRGRHGRRRGRLPPAAADGPDRDARLLHADRRRPLRLGADRRDERAVGRLRDGRHAAPRAEHRELARGRPPARDARAGPPGRGRTSPRRRASSSLGGHSITDPEPKYGMVGDRRSSTPDAVVRNSTRLAGDALFLTKPLGLGIVSTAIKRGIADADLVASGGRADDDAEPRGVRGDAATRRPTPPPTSPGSGCSATCTGCSWHPAWRPSSTRARSR